jgi:hypothetical protein
MEYGRYVCFGRRSDIVCKDPDRNFETVRTLPYPYHSSTTAQGPNLFVFASEVDEHGYPRYKSLLVFGPDFELKREIDLPASTSSLRIDGQYMYSYGPSKEYGPLIFRVSNMEGCL